MVKTFYIGEQTRMEHSLAGNVQQVLSEIIVNKNTEKETTQHVINTIWLLH